MMSLRTTNGAEILAYTERKIYADHGLVLTIWHNADKDSLIATPSDSDSIGDGWRIIGIVRWDEDTDFVVFESRV